METITIDSLNSVLDRVHMSRQNGSVYDVCMTNQLNEINCQNVSQWKYCFSVWELLLAVAIITTSIANMKTYDFFFANYLCWTGLAFWFYLHLTFSITQIWKMADKSMFVCMHSTVAFISTANEIVWIHYMLSTKVTVRSSPKTATHIPNSDGSQRTKPIRIC